MLHDLEQNNQDNKSLSKSGLNQKDRTFCITSDPKYTESIDKSESNFVRLVEHEAQYLYCGLFS